MFDLQPNHLKNNLISLSPLQENDFEELYAVAADPMIWEQHPEKERYKRAVFQKFFDSAIAGKSAFMIVDKVKGNVIGSSRYYDYYSENSAVAIGFTFLATAYWGGYYNKIIKQLMLDYAFTMVDKVHFHIGSDNIRSRKALEKIGGVWVSDFVRGSNEDMANHVEYVISKDNWQKQRP